VLFEKLRFEVKKFKKLVAVGIILLMVGFTVMLIAAASMTSDPYQPQPVSGTTAYAYPQYVIVPPDGYFIKILNTTPGQTIGGSYEASARFNVYVFNQANFQNYISGSPDTVTLSSTLNALCACYYTVSLQGGPIYIVIHNPTNQPQFLRFCLHFFNTQSIVIPNPENSVYQLFLLIGGLLSVAGFGTIVLPKIYERRQHA
jgi:hypothetical protein